MSANKTTIISINGRPFITMKDRPVVWHRIRTALGQVTVIKRPIGWVAR